MSECVITLDKLREAVALMRELGVLQCGGVTLGPEPRPSEALVRKMATAPPAEAAILKEELETELRRQRLDAARQDVKDKLGRDVSDEEADRFIDVGALR